jgi:hypothetical protein
MPKGEVSMLTQDNWYQVLIQELKELLTEREFSIRWEIISVYHELGSMILSAHEKHGITLNILCGNVAKDLERSKRTIYYSVQFVKKYPVLNTLPYGKNVSWRKITHELLDEEKKALPECIHEWVIHRRCKLCGVWEKKEKVLKNEIP